MDDKKEEMIKESNNNNLPFTEYIQKNINPDGNCFYRCISYFFRQTEEAYPEFRNLLYDWMVNNKESFIDIIPEETSNNTQLSKEERLKKLNKLIDNINTDAEWGADLEISGMSVILNINITLYIKDDLNYKYYYKFEGSDLPNNNINIIFINNNHFDLLIIKT